MSKDSKTLCVEQFHNDTDSGMNPSPLIDGLSSSAFTTIALYSFKDRVRITIILSTVSLFKRTTRHRLSRAEFRLNDGFSVVAPINVIKPLSTCGRKMSYTEMKVRGKL